MLSVNIGAVFEEFAVEKLKADGYKILAQNYRCRFGEIDIIALKKSVISFIEVKARYEKAPFFPEEAVTVKKLTHITLSASVRADNRGESLGKIKRNFVREGFKTLQFQPFQKHNYPPLFCCGIKYPHIII